jgi:hypothetical protein
MQIPRTAMPQYRTKAVTQRDPFGLLLSAWLFACGGTLRGLFGWHLGKRHAARWETALLDPLKGALETCTGVRAAYCGAAGPGNHSNGRATCARRLGSCQPAANSATRRACARAVAKRRNLWGLLLSTGALRVTARNSMKSW